MIIFVFGNEYLENDSSAKMIAKELNDLHGVEFVDCKSVSELFNSGEKKPIILDVVENIDDVILIEDIDQIKDFRSISAHDMDLAFHLKMYKELGVIEKVKIIGVPQKFSEENVKKVREMVEKIRPN